MRVRPPVLVTGSAGFVGRCLVRALRARGREVVCFDLRDRRRARDVRSEEALRACMPEGAEVYHLASVVGVRHVLCNPHATWSTAVRGTELLCRVARERGARVLLASSSEVYGEGSGRVLAEDEPLPASYGAWPRASYPEGKRRAEQIVARFAEDGVDARIARLFNVSGPGQRAASGMFVPTLVEALLAGRPVPIVDDGSDVRCFQHVEDACSGLIRLMELEDAPEGVCNIGGGDPRSVLDFAARAARVLGRSFEPRFVTSTERYGASATRCRSRVPDLRKSEALFGHRAQLGFDRIVTDLARELARAAGRAEHHVAVSEGAASCVASSAARQA